MGQGQQSSIRPHRTDIIDPSNWIDWSNELLLRLQTVAELRGVQLDTTLCSLSDHPGCRISLCVARLCGICGVKGFETQCNYCAAQAFCRNEPTCTLCGRYVVYFLEHSDAGSLTVVASTVIIA
jgi:hypothetical protein